MLFFLCRMKRDWEKLSCLQMRAVLSQSQREEPYLHCPLKKPFSKFYLNSQLDSTMWKDVGVLRIIWLYDNRLDLKLIAYILGLKFWLKLRLDCCWWESLEVVRYCLYAAIWLVILFLEPLYKCCWCESPFSLYINVQSIGGRKACFKLIF